MTDTIDTGLVWVDGSCPRCGVHEQVAVVLTPVLTIPEGDTPTLKIRAQSKPVNHLCGQAQLQIAVGSAREA